MYHTRISVLYSSFTVVFIVMVFVHSAFSCGFMYCVDNMIFFFFIEVTYFYFGDIMASVLISLRFSSLISK